jgi:DNA-binding transcriptional LysR family regulator
MKVNNKIMRDWTVFITVVEACSFSIAAKKLYCSVASVSNSVARLEYSLGTILLNRNAHRVEVTSAGVVTYKRAKEIQQIYYELSSEVSSRDASIKGRIRFSAPSILCEHVANRWVYDYMCKHRDAHVHLLSRDRTALTVSSPEFDDLVLKSGFINSPDLVHQELPAMRFLLCASPEYIKEHGVIDSPDALARHWIMKVNHPFLDYPLTLKNEHANCSLCIDNHTQLTSNNVSSLLRMTLSGAGVCLALPEWLAMKYVRRNQLSVILPQWHLPELPIYLVWRYRKNYSNLFLDFKKEIALRWCCLLVDGVDGFVE